MTRSWTQIMLSGVCFLPSLGCAFCCVCWVKVSGFVWQQHGRSRLDPCIVSGSDLTESSSKFPFVCHWFRGALCLFLSYFLRLVVIYSFSVFWGFFWGVGKDKLCDLLLLHFADVLNYYYSPRDIILCLAQALNSHFPTGLRVVGRWLPKRKPRYTYQMMGKWTLWQGKKSLPTILLDRLCSQTSLLTEPKTYLGLF